MSTLFEEEFKEDLDPEFKQEAIYIQLARIIDSKSAEEIYNPKGKVKDYFRRFNPITTVKTDDGVEFAVTVEEAKRIREALLKIPTPRRAEIFKEMQVSKGFARIVEVLR